MILNMYIEIKTKRNRRYKRILGEEIKSSNTNRIIDLILNHASTDSIITILTTPHPTVDENQAKLPFPDLKGEEQNVFRATA